MLLALTKGTILLINDDIDTKNALAYGLKRHGFDVTAFGDPEQAIVQFEPNYYGFVLLDVKMPATTAFKVAKRIWALEPVVKIYFFSAFDIYEKEVKILFKDLKTSCFIKKPILPSELAKVIESQLQPSNQKNWRL